MAIIGILLLSLWVYVFLTSRRFADIRWKGCRVIGTLRTCNIIHVKFHRSCTGKILTLSVLLLVFPYSTVFALSYWHAGIVSPCAIAGSRSGFQRLSCYTLLVSNVAGQISYCFKVSFLNLWVPIKSIYIKYIFNEPTLYFCFRLVMSSCCLPCF